MRRILLIMLVAIFVAIFMLISCSSIFSQSIDKKFVGIFNRALEQECTNQQIRIVDVSKVYVVKKIVLPKKWNGDSFHYFAGVAEIELITPEKVLTMSNQTFMPGSTMKGDIVFLFTVKTNSTEEPVSFDFSTAGFFLDNKIEKEEEAKIIKELKSVNPFEKKT